MTLSLIIRILCVLVTVVSSFWCLITREADSSPRNDFQSHPAVADSFCIGVRGNKFHWDFTYPGPDGVLNTQDDVAVDRMLRIPPGKTVTFHLTSDDYIYILGIPVNEIGSGDVEKIREIAVPDLVHTLQYRSDEPGSLDLLVDPLCGFKPLHDPLMGSIVVTENYDYRSLLPQVDDSN